MPEVKQYHLIAHKMDEVPELNVSLRLVTYTSRADAYYVALSIAQMFDRGNQPLEVSVVEEVVVEGEA